MDTDGGHVARNREDGKTCAAVKRVVTDIGDIVGDRDASHAGTVKKRPNSDACDWQTVGGGGDGYVTVDAGVSRDGDRAVVGRERELGLHCGGQQQ